MSKIALSGNASGTGTFTLTSPSTNTDQTLTLPDSTGTVATLGTTLTAGTAVTVSGTSIDFTGIPSWVKRITVMFQGISLSGTSNFLIRVGTNSAPATTGYNSGASSVATNTSNTTNGSASNTTNGFTTLGYASTAAATASGQFVLTNISGNSWIGSGVLYSIGNLRVVTFAGDVTLSDTLTQVRITTVNGTDNFDAGTINILYEG
jgi:hypothetical protein